MIAEGLFCNACNGDTDYDRSDNGEFICKECGGVWG